MSKKKKAKLSKNEKEAKKKGVSLKEYKASKSKKSSKKSDKKSSKSSSKDEKKATKKIEEYYEKKSATAKEQAAVETKRIQEDVANILKEAGILSTRAIEDYTRNIGNIEANKALDVSTLQDYVSTTKGRTGEDLDISLAKESRRYALEYDQINEDLASRGLTFSERTPEKIAKESSRLATEGINLEANRSFQDIARYEAAKTAELNLKYGTQTEEATTSKTRTLEDIIEDQQKAILTKTRGKEDIASGLKETLTDYSYGKDTGVATTKQLFESADLAEEIRKQEWAFKGWI